MGAPAFAPVFPLPLVASAAKSPARRLRNRATCLSLKSPGDEQQNDGSKSDSSNGTQPSKLFLDDDPEPFWKSMDVNKAFAPLTEEEKAQLREKLPDRVAQFLIRRADDAVAQRDPKRTESGFVSKLLQDMPPDAVDWEAKENEEYRDYVYEASAGAPSFRRRGSSLFGGGDGLPEEDNKVMSLFVGNVNSVDEQASRVGYGLLTLVVAFILLKLLLGLISFFVSFTFSFLAIFALSAGIFVVFFLLRF